jgi:hypothetical protein
MRAQLIALGLAIAACSSTTAAENGRMVASTQRLNYSPGDSVVLRFVNLTGEVMEYNACFASLLQRQGSELVNLGPATTLPCRGVGFTLGPGAADSTRFGLPADLPAGVYRYLFDQQNFLGQDGTPLAMSDRYSNLFEVQ